MPSPISTLSPIDSPTHENTFIVDSSKNGPLPRAFSTPDRGSGSDQTVIEVPISSEAKKDETITKVKYKK